MSNRIDTKAKRVELQNFKIEYYTNKGYSMEQYKDVKILTMKDETFFYVASFVGTQTKPAVNFRMRQEESFLKQVESIKSSADFREKRKQNQTSD